MSQGVLPFLYRRVNLEYFLGNQEKSLEVVTAIHQGACSSEPLQVKQHCHGCSSSFKCLVESVLRADHRKRPSAPQVLQDNWFKYVDLTSLKFDEEWYELITESGSEQTAVTVEKTIKQEWYELITESGSEQ